MCPVCNSGPNVVGTGHRCGGELSGLLSSNVCLSKILTALIYILLILLQTDSSPSLSLAQLAKVVFPHILAVLPGNVCLICMYSIFFLIDIHLFFYFPFSL